MSDRRAADLIDARDIDALCALIARFLDRCEIDASAEVIRDALALYVSVPDKPPASLGVGFRATTDIGSSDPHAVVRGTFVAVCLASYAAFLGAGSGSAGCLSFLRPALDNDPASDLNLHSQATVLLRAELANELERLPPDDDPNSREIGTLLLKCRDGIRLPTAAPHDPRHNIVGGEAPTARDIDGRQDVGVNESNIPVDVEYIAHYDEVRGDDPQLGISIEDDQNLEELAGQFARTALDTTDGTRSLVAIIMDAVRALRAGISVRLVSDAGEAATESTVATGRLTSAGFAKAGPLVTSPQISGPDLANTEIGPPVPTLSDEQLAAVRHRAQERPWNKRGSNPPTPFEWVRDNYREWIPGLLQSHLKADPQLYGAFTQRVRREGLPSWLDVPTETDARLRNTTDPDERRRLLMARSWEAERSRRRREQGLIR